MKKVLIGLLVMGSFSSFAEINCGQTWKEGSHLYMDDNSTRGEDIEVLVPQIATPRLKAYKRSPKGFSCIKGKKVSFQRDGSTLNVFVGMDLQ